MSPGRSCALELMTSQIPHLRPSKNRTLPLSFQVILRDRADAGCCGSAVTA